MNDILLTTARFTVQRCQYNVPGHGQVHRELVVHPGAVVVLPLLLPTDVVMIHNYRFAVDAELLELPAGTLEPPEPPLDCAARELEEETGYRAGRLEPLAQFYTSPGFTDEHMYVFLATELVLTQSRPDATEQIRVELMPLADALDATADGRIVDGKTIAALQLYHYRATRKP
jgi:ADP-ribose pyrophosphatase